MNTCVWIGLFWITACDNDYSFNGNGLGENGYGADNEEEPSEENDVQEFADPHLDFVHQEDNDENSDDPPPLTDPRCEADASSQAFMRPLMRGFLLSKRL